MAYGTVKVDNITFTNAGIDQTITVSGIVQSISGNITATGTIQGATIIGTSTVSGATVTGTTANFVTISGTTVTGTTANFTSGNFTNISGGTHTITSGVFAAGTAAAPSISFTSDPNTGIYSPGADQVAISTNGTGRLFVDASGNVGVGAAASQRFSVFSGSSAGINNVAIFKGGGSSSGNGAGLILSPDSANTYGNWYGSRIATAFGGASWGCDLIFSTNNNTADSNLTERLRITSAGLVGIGTSSPSTNLDIVVGSGTATQKLGSSSFAGGSYLNLHGASASKTWFIGANYNFAGLLEFTQSTANGGTTPGSTPAMVLSATGNVGIGTTSPSSILHLKTASNPTLILDNSDSGTAAVIDTWWAGTPLAFNIGSSEKARIDGSGRLLVGTSTARSNYGNLSGILVPQLQIESTQSNSNGIGIASNAGAISGYPGRLFFAKSRGTTNNSYDIVASGDNLGIITFEGADGTNTVTAASIYGEVDGTPGADDMPGRLVFSTTADGAASPTERMRITKEGVIKISRDGSYLSATSGVHEIRTNLDNNNALIVSSSASNGTQYGISIRLADDQNDTTRDFLECRGGATVRAQIRSNGGIANYSANDVNLSDRNAKKDIAPAAGTWGCLKNWEIVNFRYKDQPDISGLNIGVIAQQIAESCPEAVTIFQEAKEATETEPAQEQRLGVKDQQMMWMAIKALQEAQTRIETLETEVAALKGA